MHIKYTSKVKVKIDNKVLNRRNIVYVIHPREWYMRVGRYDGLCLW